MWQEAAMIACATILLHMNNGTGTMLAGRERKASCGGEVAKLVFDDFMHTAFAETKREAWRVARAV